MLVGFRGSVLLRCVGGGRVWRRGGLNGGRDLWVGHAVAGCGGEYNGVGICACVLLSSHASFLPPTGAGSRVRG